jgi:uncharacterized membrane protein YozB (DUF420 family)
MSLHLPALNATLNAASALLLLGGLAAIRMRRTALHAGLVLMALGTSMLFLVSYLIYHARVGSVPFAGTGWVRPVYFTILVSHTILAVVMVPLILVTLSRAVRRQFERHTAIARWTAPIWLYVSVTGVVVYWMLYHRP